MATKTSSSGASTENVKNTSTSQASPQQVSVKQSGGSSSIKQKSSGSQTGFAKKQSGNTAVKQSFITNSSTKQKSSSGGNGAAGNGSSYKNFDRGNRKPTPEETLAQSQRQTEQLITRKRNLETHLKELDAPSDSIPTLESSRAHQAERAEVIKQLQDVDRQLGNEKTYYSKADRVLDVLLGSEKDYLGNVGNALSTAGQAIREASGQVSDKELTELYQANNKKIAEAQKKIDEVNAKPKEEWTQDDYKVVANAQQEVKDLNKKNQSLKERQQIWKNRTNRQYQDELAAEGLNSSLLDGADKKVLDSSTAMNKGLRDASDNLSAEGQEQLAKAKSDLGKWGQIGVDVASNIIQMGTDAALKATGVGMLPFFARSAGGAAREAREAGASTNEQFFYGAASGAVEVISEKMFDGVAKLYGAGMADEAVESFVKRFKHDWSRTAVRQLINAGGEGVEEVFSDVMSIFLQQMSYNENAINDAWGSMGATGDTLGEMAYDFFIGALIGGFGSVGSIATGQNAEANRKLSKQDAVDALLGKNIKAEKAPRNDKAFKGGKDAAQKLVDEANTLLSSGNGSNAVAQIRMAANEVQERINSGKEIRNTDVANLKEALSLENKRRGIQDKRLAKLTGKEAEQEVTQGKPIEEMSIEELKAASLKAGKTADSKLQERINDRLDKLIREEAIENYGSSTAKPKQATVEPSEQQQAQADEITPDTQQETVEPTQNELNSVPEQNSKFDETINAIFGEDNGLGLTQEERDFVAKRQSETGVSEEGTSGSSANEELADVTDDQLQHRVDDGDRRLQTQIEKLRQLQKAAETLQARLDGGDQSAVLELAEVEREISEQNNLTNRLKKYIADADDELERRFKERLGENYELGKELVEDYQIRSRFINGEGEFSATPISERVEILNLAFPNDEYYIRDGEIAVASKRLSEGEPTKPLPDTYDERQLKNDKTKDTLKRTNREEPPAWVGTQKTDQMREAEAEQKAAWEASEKAKEKKFPIKPPSAERNSGVVDNGRASVVSAEEQAIIDKYRSKLATKPAIKVDKTAYAEIRSERMSRYSSLEDTDIPELDIIRLAEHGKVNEGYKYFIRNTSKDTYQVIKRSKIVPEIKEDAKNGYSVDEARISSDTAGQMQVDNSGRSGVDTSLPEQRVSYSGDENGFVDGQQRELSDTADDGNVSVRGTRVVTEPALEYGGSSATYSAEQRNSNNFVRDAEERRQQDAANYKSNEPEMMSSGEYEQAQRNAKLDAQEAEERAERDRDEAWERAQEEFGSKHKYIVNSARKASEAVSKFADEKFPNVDGASVSTKERNTAVRNHAKVLNDLRDGVMSVQDFSNYYSTLNGDETLGDFFDNDTAEHLARVLEIQQKYLEANAQNDYTTQNALERYRNEMVNFTARLESSTQKGIDAIAKKKNFSDNLDTKLSTGFGAFFNRMTKDPVAMFKALGGFNSHVDSAQYEKAQQVRDATRIDITLRTKAQLLLGELAQSEKYVDFSRGKVKTNVKVGSYTLTTADAVSVVKTYKTLYAETKSNYRLDSLDGLVINGKKVTSEDYGDIHEFYLQCRKAVEADKTASDFLKVSNDVTAFLAPFMKNAGMKLNGYENEMYGYGDYFPVIYSRGTSEDIKRSTTEVFDNRHLKERTRMNGGYVDIRNAADVLQSYINGSVNTIAWGELGQQLQAMNKTTDFGEGISSLVGGIDTEYSNWMDGFINRVNGTTDYAKESWGNKQLRNLRQHFTKGTLMLSPTVPIKQVSSYWSAAGALDFDILASCYRPKFGSIVTGHKSDGNIIAASRLTGSLNQEIGQGSDSYLFAKLKAKSDMVNKIANLTNIEDYATIDNLYAATIKQVQKDNPNLDVESKEFHDAVEDKFADVVISTQPIFTSRARAEYLSTNNEIVRLFSNFRTQQTQNLNNIATAIGEYKADLRNGIDSDAGKNLRHVVAGQAASYISFAALGVIADMAMHKFKKYDRDKDDEEYDETKGTIGNIDPNKVLLQFMGKMGSAGFSTVPFGNEAWSWAYSKITNGEVDDFYGISLGPLTTLQQTADALQTFGTNLVTGDATPKQFYNALRYTTQSLGVPIHNLYQPVNAIVQFAKDASNEEDRGMYDSLIDEINADFKAERALRQRYEGNVKAVKRAEDNGEEYTGWRTFKEADIDYGQWQGIYGKYQELNNNDELSASGKAERFNVWLRNEGYSDKQREFAQEEFGFYSQVRGETEKLDTLVALGMSPESALTAKDAISAKDKEIDEYNAQFPEGDTRRKSFGGWDKLGTLTALGLDDKETDIAAGEYLSDTQSVYYTAFRNSGAKPSQVRTLVNKLDADGNGSVTQAEFKAFYNANNAYDAALEMIWNETKMWHESDGPKSTKSKKTWSQVKGK